MAWCAAAGGFGLAACSSQTPAPFTAPASTTPSSTANAPLPGTLQLPHALGGGAAPTGTSSTAPAKTLHPLGLKKRTAPLTPRPPAPEIAPAALPVSVDLSQGAPTPGNQGQTGSCATWATGYSAMGWWDARTGLGGAPYAPMFIYAQVVQGDCSTGSEIAGDLDLMKSEGMDTSADYEPMEEQLDCASYPSAANMAVAAKYKISDYVEDDATDAESAIEKELAAGHPVILGIDVYDNFENADSVNYLVGPPAGQDYGGHAIAAFKYDANGVWILNSWGTTWGQNGWAELSWDYIAATCDEVVAITGVVGGKVSPNPPSTDGGAPADGGADAAADGGSVPPLPPAPGPPPFPSGGGNVVVSVVSPADGSSLYPGQIVEIVVTTRDASATITDVALTWTAPSATITQEMGDWGDGEFGIDLNLDPSAVSGPRTVTIVATDSNGDTGQITETLQVQ
jgi:hypothetical protein